MWPEIGVDHPTPSSAEVKEGVLCHVWPRTLESSALLRD